MIIDIVHPENLANPYPLYRHLQEHDPVHWAPSIFSWFVTRYSDVAACLRDPRLSSVRTMASAALMLRGRDVSIVKDYLRVTEQFMFMIDGPEHVRLRKHASHGFTTSALDTFRPIIVNIVDSLLAQMEGKTGIELVTEFAEPLPAITMAELFDIPKEDRAKFQGWTDAMARFFGGSLADIEQVAREANEGMLGMEAYLTHTIALRRKNPGRDLISLLLSYEEDGKMSTAELVANTIDLLAAGLATVKDQIGNTVYELLSRPEILARVRQDPALLKAAIEEALRCNPAAPNTYRIASEDLELCGKQIQKGQLVFVSLAAANRDPEVFSDPDRFDIDRQPNKHIAFGVGPHACLGLGLARRQLELGIGGLLRRFPHLHFDPQNPPQPRRDNFVFSGWNSLHLVFAQP